MRANSWFNSFLKWSFSAKCFCYSLHICTEHYLERLRTDPTWNYCFVEVKSVNQVEHKTTWTSHKCVFTSLGVFWRETIRYNTFTLATHTQTHLETLCTYATMQLIETLRLWAKCILVNNKKKNRNEYWDSQTI